tara:strand:- start:315 stop:557 length:243 start_codon:yes stop_codon:yes gene_type:complete
VGKIKRVIGVLLIMVLLGCNKKSKPCTTCPQFSYVYYDTVVISIPHYNYNGMCFPNERIVIIEKEEILIEQPFYLKPKQR